MFDKMFHKNFLVFQSTFLSIQKCASECFFFSGQYKLSWHWPNIQEKVSVSGELCVYVYSLFTLMTSQPSSWAHPEWDTLWHQSRRHGGWGVGLSPTK